MKADLPPKEKEAIIIEEFEELGYDINRNLTRQQLEEIIDAKTGHKFDADVMDELYSNMRKEPDGTTTLEDFAHVWLEADNRLRSKIDYCDRLTDEYKEQREEASVRLLEAQGSERMNANGIMEGSQLVVFIGKGTNFYDDDGQPFNPYIILSCENQKYETQATANNHESFTWNEEFNIPIQHANTNLEIHLFNSVDEPELMISIPLQKLRDQLKHEDIFPLSFTDGRPSDARLSCTLQWIHSNVKFLTDVIKKWDNSVGDQKSKKKDYIENLNIIYEPFENLKHLQIVPEPKVAYRAGTMENKHNKLETPFAQPMKYDNTTASWLFYLMGAYLLLSMFNCFYRCVFYDLWIILGYLSSNFFDLPVFSRGTCMGLFIFLVVTLFIDMIWLYNYTRMWWTDIYVDDGSLLGLRKFEVFISYIIFFLKVKNRIKNFFKLAIGFFLFVLSRTLPKRPKNLPYRGSRATASMGDGSYLSGGSVQSRNQQSDPFLSSYDKLEDSGY